ncbi:MAG: SigB/SigF/SigG family RNA polymerase sigma factor [bacterium]
MNKVEITGVNTSNLKTLPNKEMVILLKEVKEGNKESREKMIVGNLKLILSVLKKFQNRRDNMDDLFQVGVIGLMKSIDNFDDSHNVRFSTYAVPMIIGEIKRYLRDNSSIRVSRSLKDIAYKSIAIKDEYIANHGREATVEEIANRLEVDPLDVVLAFEAIQDTISMSTPIFDNGGDVIELSDQIASKEAVESNVIKDHQVKHALASLTGRGKTIIYDRYFNNKTQMEIAAELGISQAQVSRIEKTALKQMKEVIS